MQISQANVLESLRGVQGFLDLHAELFPTLTNSGVRQRLDAKVTELTNHGTTQNSSFTASKGATQKKSALYDALYNGQMKPIARIAAADLPTTPELTPLKMPRGRPNAEVLYTAAMAMADTADQYASVFVAALLPPDFSTQLRNAAKALIGSIDTRTKNRGSRKGATTGVNTALADARKIVRIVDAVVRPVLSTDPPLLTTWNTVKRPPTKTSKGAPNKPKPAAGTPALTAGTATPVALLPGVSATPPAPTPADAPSPSTPAEATPTPTTPLTPPS